MRMLIVLGSGLTLGLVASHGCAYRELDLTHCAQNDGDAYCAERFPDGSRPYCQRGTSECYTPDTEFGCVAAEDKPADECYSPCGGRSTVLDNGECLMMEESSSGSSSGGTTTEESGSESSSGSSTTGPIPCMSDEECTTPDAPGCDTAKGECVSCDMLGEEGDAACASVDGGMNPVCLDGACVQCTEAAPEACTGMTPVCDDTTNTCVPCTEHDQCGEAACNLFTGACLPADAVVHVGADQTYTTIGAAVDSFNMMMEGTIIVHAAMPNYDEVVTVDGGRVLAFLAADDVVTPPRWLQGSGGSPQLTVGDATVLMDGLQLSGNADALGLLVDGGRAWVDRSRIVQNTGGGIVAQNASELVLRNCFVGDGTNGENALAVDGTMAMSSAEVSYTTLGVGFDNFEDVFPVFCNGTVEVSIRNSVLVSVDNGVELSCSTATVSNTASESLIPGTANVALGDVGADWFVDIDTGNFHLNNPPGMLATIAQWQTGDPPTDIDGDLRPTVDGTADFAGADVP